MVIDDDSSPSDVTPIDWSPLDATPDVVLDTCLDCAEDKWDDENWEDPYGPSNPCGDSYCGICNE